MSLVSRIKQMWNNRMVESKSWNDQISKLPSEVKERIYADIAAARNAGKENTPLRPLIPGEKFQEGGGKCIAIEGWKPGMEAQNKIKQCFKPATHIAYNTKDGWPYHFCDEHKDQHSESSEA